MVDQPAEQVELVAMVWAAAVAVATTVKVAAEGIQEAMETMQLQHSHSIQGEAVRPVQMVAD